MLANQEARLDEALQNPAEVPGIEPQLASQFTGGGALARAQLKQDPGLRKIPVIIYSTSDNDQEKRKGLSLGATEYIVKPMGYSQGLEIVRRIVGFLKQPAKP